jgi:hypothetical protein
VSDNSGTNCLAIANHMVLVVAGETCLSMMPWAPCDANRHFTPAPCCAVLCMCAPRSPSQTTRHATCNAKHALVRSVMMRSSGFALLAFAFTFRLFNKQKCPFSFVWVGLYMDTKSAVRPPLFAWVRATHRLDAFFRNEFFNFTLNLHSEKEVKNTYKIKIYLAQP